MSEHEGPQGEGQEQERKPGKEGHGSGGARQSGEGHGGMGKRGVTRPMAQHPPRGSEHGGKRGQGGGHAMSSEDRKKMLGMHHAQTVWVWWTLILLGVWMVLAPLTFGQVGMRVEPSGGREVWLSMEWRVRLMGWSDALSGLALLFFGWRSLKPGRTLSQWACCFVGIWLSMAPVLFWAPTAVSYLNGTLVGMLVIALSILVPGMPGMMRYMKMGPPRPPGWTYNPSSWPQRAVMIGLGFLGFLVSRYLAAFQLGYIDTIWDPFFGESTRNVLNSNMSHALPISDAALGTLAYTFEFLMGFMGSPSRWRTMPWMVTFYGILVIPLGLVHIGLVISQPVVVGQWCTFCLLAAAIMLPMLPLEGDEVVAMGQHLVQAKRRGESLWKVFWKGGEPEGSQPDERDPGVQAFPEAPVKVVRAGLWGMSVPWGLALCSLLGVGLMALPGLLDVQKPASAVFHLCGAMIVTVSVVAWGEVFRLVRRLNLPLAAAVAVLPWVLGGAGLGARVVGLLAGVAVAVLSLPRGPKRESYGSWDRFVR